MDDVEDLVYGQIQRDLCDAKKHKIDEIVRKGDIEPDMTNCEQMDASNVPFETDGKVKIDIPGNNHI